MAPHALDSRLFTSAGGESWLSAMLAVLLFPPLLVGEDIVSPWGWSAVPALTIAAVSIVYAFIWIGDHDIALEAAQ
jgi:hypothetical protein